MGRQIDSNPDRDAAHAMASVPSSGGTESARQMTIETVTLQLPRALLARAQILAKDREMTVGDILRQFLETETATLLTGKRDTKELVIAGLVPTFVEAKGWQDLRARLTLRGFELRPAGSGLAMHETRNGRLFCNTARVGFRYRKLVKRFGGPMPGHPHGTPPTPDRNEEGFDVIERA